MVKQFPRPSYLLLSKWYCTKMCLFVVCTAFVLHLVWRNSTLTCVTIYWGNVYAGCGDTCLSFDHGRKWNNSSIILIVVKWCTNHSIHQKVEEKCLGLIVFNCLLCIQASEKMRSLCHQACTFYERLNRSPYITTQAFFCAKKS